LRLCRKKPGYPLQFLSHRQVPAGGLRDFRFYPLRCPKAASAPLLGLEFLLRKNSRKWKQPASVPAKSNGLPGGVWGEAPNSENPKGAAFWFGIHAGPGCAETAQYFPRQVAPLKAAKKSEKNSTKTQAKMRFHPYI
jgi:hypothetical protein